MPVLSVAGTAASTFSSAAVTHDEIHGDEQRQGGCPHRSRPRHRGGGSRSVNGELAGGMVMSLMTQRDRGIVVAVLCNITHANTSALGLKIGDAFAKQVR
jgi:hypothetical protein